MIQFLPHEKQIRNSNLGPSPDISFVLKNISKNLPQDANITNFDLSSVLIPITKNNNSSIVRQALGITALIIDGIS